uniref:Uncharacterized protein n=1 Tax=Timema poppense TaxID=170557 RepID=A0A7R9HAD4_TIMPO|nr:unnamed protein product [Timema poppensis]
MGKSEVTYQSTRAHGFYNIMQDLMEHKTLGGEISECMMLAEDLFGQINKDILELCKLVQSRHFDMTDISQIRKQIRSDLLSLSLPIRILGIRSIISILNDFLRGVVKLREEIEFCYYEDDLKREGLSEEQTELKSFLDKGIASTEFFLSQFKTNGIYDDTFHFKGNNSFEIQKNLPEEKIQAYHTGTAKFLFKLRRFPNHCPNEKETLSTYSFKMKSIQFSLLGFQTYKMKSDGVYYNHFWRVMRLMTDQFYRVVFDVVNFQTDEMETHGQFMMEVLNNLKDHPFLSKQIKYDIKVTLAYYDENHIEALGLRSDLVKIYGPGLGNFVDPKSKTIGKLFEPKHFNSRIYMTCPDCKTLAMKHSRGKGLKYKDVLHVTLWLYRKHSMSVDKRMQFLQTERDLQILIKNIKPNHVKQKTLKQADLFLHNLILLMRTMFDVSALKMDAHLSSLIQLEHFLQLSFYNINHTIFIINSLLTTPLKRLPTWEFINVFAFFRNSTLATAEVMSDIDIVLPYLKEDINTFQVLLVMKREQEIHFLKIDAFRQSWPAFCGVNGTGQGLNMYMEVSFLPIMRHLPEVQDGGVALPPGGYAHITLKVITKLNSVHKSIRNKLKILLDRCTTYLHKTY